MNHDERELELLIDALRTDVPSAADEARIRARLMGVGVLGVGSLVVTSAAAGVSSAGASSSSVALSAAGGSTAAQAGGLGAGAVIASTPMTAATSLLGTASVSGMTSAAGNAGALGLLSKVIGLPLAVKLGTGAALFATVATTAVVHTVGTLDAELAATPTVVSRGVVGDDVGVRAPQKAARADAVDQPGLPKASGAAIAEVVSQVSTLAVAAPVAQERLKVAAPEESRRTEVRASVTRSESATRAVDTKAQLGLPAAGTLTEETRLIEQALVALRSNDAERARYWLEEHARRFPAGALVPERERALQRAQQR